MKKIIILICILLTLYTSKTYAVCNHVSHQVTSITQNVSCTCSFFRCDTGLYTKYKNYSISWSDGVNSSWSNRGQGQCLYNGSSGNILDCYPIYYVPFYETSNNKAWMKQRVQNRLANTSVSCGNDASVTRGTLHTCQTTGGGINYECDPFCQTNLTDDSKSDDNTSNSIDSCCTLSPIVVDIDGDGFSLTSASNGVMFDFNGDGVPHRMSWTKRNSDEAWLVLDRNGNGTIDDGSELFGNLTPQPQVEQKHGFLALAEYDKLENGGNEDGKINKLDAIFSDLRLWQDKNHNGISERSELKKLRRLDVKAFMLNYKTSNRVDRHGNEFRYKAKVKDTRDGNVGKWAWDVFLVLDEEETDLKNVEIYK